MTARRGCVRGARGLALCGLRVCVEGSAEGSGAVCVCMCVCVCVCVCGLGVWSLARAWGEPADGWDEKRAAVFTLLWGPCMNTGTLPRPLLYKTHTQPHTHTPTHQPVCDCFTSFVSHQRAKTRSTLDNPKQRSEILAFATNLKTR